MKRYLSVFLIITSALLFCFCGRENKTDRLLNRADSLLIKHPDSALAVIGSIPMNDIRPGAQQAEFILLYERILDKNGISLIGETDMEEAVRYFDRSGDPGKKLLSRFYLGRIYDLAGNYYQAMEQYVQAEGAYLEISPKDLEQNGAIYGDVLAGLYLYKGDIFHSKINFNGALKMYLKAVEYYRENGNDSQLMHVMGKVAKGYEALNKYEQALEAYDSALNIARKNKNEKDILEYATSVAGARFAMGAPCREILSRLDTIYATYNGGVPPVDNYILLSCLYLDDGNTQKAKQYAQQYIYSNPGMNLLEEAGLASLMGSIAKVEGDYKAALEYKERYSEIIDSINEQEKANSLQEIEQLYYNKQLKIENESIKKQSRYVLIIYSLLLVILLGGLLWLIIAWRRKIREKNIQIEEYLATVHNAELSKNNLLGQLDIHIEKEKRLKELLENRFAEIRELAGTYYEYGYSKKLQRKVEELLSLQSFGGDMFEVIENVVNAKNNDAMVKIRKNYPSITEDNFKLLNLIYAGFSPQEISVILNDTPQNIYVRKSRLKRKIAVLIEQDPELDFR